jgi:large subunit ribosomal protein L10
MAKTKERKAKDLADLTKKLEDSTSVIFANFYGLKVKDIEELRVSCRKSGLRVSVAKKNLLKMALKKCGIEPISLGGEIVAVFGEDDILPAKSTADFAKTHEPLKILAGLAAGKWIDSSVVKTLAKLPSREELLAKLFGSINAPASNFVNVLAGNLRGLVYVLNAIKDKK